MTYRNESDLRDALRNHYSDEAIAKGLKELSETYNTSFE